MAEPARPAPADDGMDAFVETVCEAEMPADLEILERQVAVSPAA